MAIITIDKGHKLVQDAISKGLKHDGYLRTCQLREDYTTIATGKGYARFLARLPQRETMPELDQRAALTYQNLSSTASPILKKAEQLSRVQDIKKGISFQNTTDRDIQDFANVLADFGGEGSSIRGTLEDYITRSFDIPSQIDPNAFLVMDFEGFDPNRGERARPYAVKFDCPNVYNFRYTRGKLDYLQVVTFTTYRDTHDYKRTAKDFIIYGGPFIIRYFELTEDRPDIPLNGTLWESNSKYYLAVEYRPGTKEVPAVRLGDLPDAETNGETCVSRLFHAALDQFVELINLKSLSDIVTRKHAFPRRYERAPVCEGEIDESGQRMACIEGVNQVTQQKCRACDGTGFKTFKSEQDTVRLQLTGTESVEDLWDLAKLTFTEKPDLETIKYLEERVDRHKQAIFITIYSSDQQVKTEGPTLSPTATAFVASREDQNNTLLPIADQKSFIYKSLVKFIAEIMNISGEVTAPYDFPRDLKLNSADEILTEIATNAGKVSSAVLNQQYDDYFEKVYETDSIGLAWHYFKKAHIEFYLMPDAEFQFYVTSGFISEYDRTCKVYQERIIEDLRNTVPNILDLSYEQQEAAVKKVLDTIVSDLPKPVDMSMGLQPQKQLE